MNKRKQLEDELGISHIRFPRIKDIWYRIFPLSDWLWVSDGLFRRFLRGLYKRYLNELFIPKGTKVDITESGRLYKEAGGHDSVRIWSPGKGIQETFIEL